ncbi:hypothetical protein [Jejuia spongiicola]|uniref:Uncharacterized protein n=1 Tax=Jejuia spongiicola TaxID=2942207 RepID=A0ABT0QGY7_9FLAO|nr:hypothetical protein [Jejuia spongiicola]MCL6296248.1 hypothetical protein [Jejuia spongiicola]
MNIKILSIISIFILISSCKKTEEEENSPINTTEITSQELSEKDISKLDYLDFALDEKTEQVIENWGEYYQIQDIVTNVKEGDLNFFKEKETIKTLLTDLKKNIPELVNTSATLARLQVLETKIYKLESLSNLSTTNKEALKSSIKEFLISFSNLNFQMNKKLEKDSNNIQKPQ